MRSDVLKYSVLAYCILGIPCMWAADNNEDDDGPRSDAERTKEVMDDIKRHDADIELIGQVVDQYRTPVNGAAVVMQMTRFSPKEELFMEVIDINRKTDERGCFSVSGMRGSGISVHDIQKDGFEYKHADNPNSSFRFDVEGDTGIHAGDKTHPLIFRMRKKSETTFLLMNGPSRFSVETKPDGRNYGAELIMRRRGRWHHFTPTNWPGFKVSIAPQTNATQLITIRGKHSEDSFFSTDKLIYEAPEKGYQSSFELTIPYSTNFLFRYQTNLVLVIKNANPACFSRVQLELRAEQEGVRCFYDTAVNPYGERNLEYATELEPYWQVRDRLGDEAVKALSEGRLAVKPDLKKLIEEAKKLPENER